MSSFLRKALNWGPFRVNISKSGIGASLGVKGARVGVRPDGQAYVHAGRHGLYYRANIGEPGEADGGDDVAAAVRQLLEESEDEWLPAVKTLYDSTASKERKSEAGAQFNASTSDVLQALKNAGFPIGADGEFSERVSSIHTEIVLSRAFPEQYASWQPEWDELLGRASDEAIRIAEEEGGAMFTRLMDGEKLIDVIRDVSESTIMEELERAALVLHDNPICEMRLGGIVSNAVMSELLDRVPE